MPQICILRFASCALLSYNKILQINRLTIVNAKRKLQIASSRLPRWLPHFLNSNCNLWENTLSLCIQSLNFLNLNILYSDLQATLSLPWKYTLRVGMLTVLSSFKFVICQHPLNWEFWILLYRPPPPVGLVPLTQGDSFWGQPINRS